MRIDEGEVVFRDGLARLTLAVPANPVSTELVEKSFFSIRTVLQARQLLTRQSFNLTGPNITHERADGGRDITIIAGTGELKLTGFAVDIRVTASDGTVVRDSKAERLAHDRIFLQRLATAAATSPTVKQMLESFSNSVSDPDNELVHLYEVRDAAVEHFGSESAARKALGVSKSEWGTLGRLANDAPLKQGRHRGKQIKGVRDATNEELQQARTIARRILESLARV